MKRPSSPRRRSRGSSSSCGWTKRANASPDRGGLRPGARHRDHYFQIVGATDGKARIHLEEGGCLQDFVGPLGRPSETEGLKKVARHRRRRGLRHRLPGGEKAPPAGRGGPLHRRLPEQGPGHPGGGVPGGQQQVCDDDGRRLLRAKRAW